MDAPEDNAYCAQEEIQGMKVAGKGFAGDTQISRIHPGLRLMSQITGQCNSPCVGSKALITLF